MARGVRLHGAVVRCRVRLRGARGTCAWCGGAARGAIARRAGAVWGTLVRRGGAVRQRAGAVGLRHVAQWCAAAARRGYDCVEGGGIRLVSDVAARRNGATV